MVISVVRSICVSREEDEGANEREIEKVVGRNYVFDKVCSSEVLSITLFILSIRTHTGRQRTIND